MGELNFINVYPANGYSSITVREPFKSNIYDAGIDLASVGDYIIEPLTSVIIPTSISVELPDNTMGLIKPRGRSEYLIGSGVLDFGYTGEILVRVFNPLGNKNIAIRDGQFFAQLVPLVQPLPYTVRYSSVRPAEPYEGRSTGRGDSGGIVAAYKRNT